MEININWNFSTVWAYNIIDFINDSIQFQYTKNTIIYTYRTQSIWISIQIELLRIGPCTIHYICIPWHCSVAPPSRGLRTHFWGSLLSRSSIATWFWEGKTVGGWWNGGGGGILMLLKTSVSRACTLYVKRFTISSRALYLPLNLRCP